MPVKKLVVGIIGYEDRGIEDHMLAAGCIRDGH